MSPSPRPDRSMDLLKQILQHPVDPDYAVAAARGGPRPRARGAVGLVATVCGLMFAVSGVQTVRSAPVIETERAKLIEQIEAQRTEQEGLNARVAAQDVEVDRLRSGALGQDAEASALRGGIAEAEFLAGATPVSGRGVVVTVSDGPESESSNEARVVDLDLQQLVNGLWMAGAEAVSINGNRLTARSAIRNAGGAITVNYRSLSSPYTVQAIGDPDRLQDGFEANSGGAWWRYLRANFGLGFEIGHSRELTLAAGSGAGLRQAKGPS